MTSYVTIQGDMWDSISFKNYGSEYYIAELIEANLEYREVVIFPANISLTIPDIDVPTTQILPPWKRSS